MKKIKNENDNNFSFIPYYRNDNYFFNIEKNKLNNENFIDNEEWEKIKLIADKKITNLKNNLNKIKLNKNLYNKQISKTSKIIKFKKFTNLTINNQYKSSNRTDNDYINLKYKTLSIEKRKKNNFYNLKLGKLNIINNNLKINPEKNQNTLKNKL
jgi:hypothetical protein